MQGSKLVGPITICLENCSNLSRMDLPRQTWFTTYWLPNQTEQHDVVPLIFSFAIYAFYYGKISRSENRDLQFIKHERDIRNLIMTHCVFVKIFFPCILDVILSNNLIPSFDLCLYFSIHILATHIVYISRKTITTSCVHYEFGETYSFKMYSCHTFCLPYLV
ncbi:putative WRKY transcription factor 49 [Iris pallida]|uniref:WRKY transcription factor 49 n=1 Tax=Iris pallida TaxID=29817 RepID=A0AAX6ERV2_IRIPA|nr:putative WRKY transcription factor 49 [Iris pallida]KAJ6822026.1 putative WRKY transcription factor 49 [Iris pallida]